jgi:NADH-quinone oxidoreductase subunit G
VGSQIRNEAPLLNVRLRKAAKRARRSSSSARHGKRPIRPNSWAPDAAILNKLPAHVWTR